jgi:RNase P subunit RPR2
MSFYPCSNCGQRANGKLATLYVNWFNEDESRSAWRLRYCVACLTMFMGELQGGRSAASQLLTVCPKCGTDASENLSGVFLTIYPPKSEQREYALTTCLSCASELRKRFTETGERLPDRNAVAAATAKGDGSDWNTIPW